MTRPASITKKERRALYLRLGELTARVAASPDAIIGIRLGKNGSKAGMSKARGDWTRLLDRLPEGIRGGALCGKEWSDEA